MNRKDVLDKINARIRGEIQQLRAYEPEPAAPPIRLDANESPRDVPAQLKQEMLESLRQVPWNRYPDPEATELRTRLAQREGVSPESVLVGNGSDELIRDLLLVYGGPGTRTVFPAPTFSMYRLLTIATGGTPVGVRLRPDWSLDEEAMAAEFRHSATRLAFIASPNNPTGNAFDFEALKNLVSGTDRLVVLDEAYCLFAENNLSTLRKEFPQAISLNTFSKSMSLAGLRLGYLVADPDVIRMLNRVRLPYNVDALAQAVACRALEHPDIWDAQAQAVKAERERLLVRLRTINDFVVFPSQANFFLVRHPRALQLKTALAASGIAVRGFGKTEGLDDCLRISVGTPEENDRLLAVCNSKV